jgi:hypothetical protein
MKNILIRVTDELHAFFAYYAKTQHRSMQSQLVFLIEDIKQQHFAAPVVPSQTSTGESHPTLEGEV